MPRIPSEGDAFKLQEMWRWYLTQRALGGGRGATMVPPGTRLARVGETAITAASESGTELTPGSGTVTLYARDDSDGKANPMTDAGGTDITMTAYSFNGAASGTDTYIFVTQDADGIWWYHSEACDAL